MRTPFGTWYAVSDEKLSASFKEMNAGKSFVLVSNDHAIRWSNIRGHMISVDQLSDGRREKTIELKVDKELSLAFANLSKQNIRNQVAIIVDGQVRSAPIINAEISSDVSITGSFRDDEVRQLTQWLNAGVVEKNQGKSIPGNVVNTAEQSSIIIHKLPSGQVNFADRVLSTIFKGDDKTLMSADELAGQIAIRAPESHQKRIADVLNSLRSANTDGLQILTPTLLHEVKLMDLNNKLEQLGLGFLNFESAYKKFPGPSNRHNGGRELPYPFSWRVAILPFIEQVELYRQYHFDEPWDSEHNWTLLDKMPAAYRSLFANESQKPGETNFVGFASMDSALGLGGGEQLQSFTDGTSPTLLLVEAANSVPWTRPYDFADPSQVVWFDDHPSTFLMADGRVRSEKMSPEELLKLISRNGGEAVKRICPPSGISFQLVYLSSGISFQLVYLSSGISFQLVCLQGGVSFQPVYTSQLALLEFLHASIIDSNRRGPFQIVVERGTFVIFYQ